MSSRWRDTTNRIGIRFLCDCFRSREAMLKNLSTRWNRSRRSTSCWLSNIIPTRTKGTKRLNESSSNWRFVSPFSKISNILYIRISRLDLKEFDRERLIRFLLFLFFFFFCNSTRRRFSVTPSRGANTTNGGIAESPSATNSGSVWRTACTRWEGIR